MSGASPWIRTQDRLPEIGQDCLIFYRSGGNSGMFVSQFETRKVDGNDKVPYGWRGPGPFSFFGWQVEWWMPVPPVPLQAEPKTTVNPINDYDMFRDNSRT